MTSEPPKPEGPQPVGALVCVVIVNWNTRDLLRACLDSLRRFPASAQTEIRVVDNGSTDGSVEMVGAEFPEVILHEPGENLGFSRANNLAIEQTSAEIVVLLNPDAEVRAGALDLAVTEVRRGLTVAARLLNPDGTLQHSCFRFPSPWIDWMEALYLHRLLPSGMRGRLLLGGSWDHGQRRIVDWALGAFLAVSRTALDAAGPLPEEYFIFGEDQEWCWRLHEAGFPVVYLPDAEVVHHGNQAGAQLDPAWRILKTHEGQERFLRAHSGAFRRWLMESARLTGYRVRSVVLALLGRRSEAAAYRHILEVLGTPESGD